MMLFILMNLKHLKRLSIALIISFILFALNIITGLFNDIPIFKSITYTLKVVSPLYFFMVLIIFSYKKEFNLKPVLLATIKLCLFLVLVGLLFFEISMNRITPQWPIYFINIHTHSYILVCTFIGISYLIYKKKKFLWLFIFLLLSFIVLFTGYNVRTAMIVYLIYIAAMLYVNHNFFKVLWLQIIIYLPVFALLFVFTSQSINYNKVSSGRLEMYEKKLDILQTYSFREVLTGRGHGSDFIRTDSWWWTKKGSHSDFITFLVENGVVYLMFFILLILCIIPSYRKFNLIYTSLVFGYFFSSLISNGFAMRPLSGYIFFLLLAYIYIDINPKRTLKATH